MLGAAAVACLIGGAALAELGYRDGTLFSEYGIPRTRTDVDDAMDGVMARVARLERWETGGTNEGYYEIACGARVDFDQVLLQGSGQIKRIAMACPTKYGPGKVLEDGAWVENKGRLTEMSWKIQGGRGGTARAATMTATDGGFEIGSSPTGSDFDLGSNGAAVKCQPNDGDGALLCKFFSGRGAENSVILGESASQRLLAWVRTTIRRRLRNMLEILDLTEAK